MIFSTLYPDENRITHSGNTGPGKESITQLVKHNPAEIYLAARTPSKAEAAIEDIEKATPGAHVTYLPLDLMSFDSIKKAADEFKSKSLRLDILMNNAGIMATPPAFTKEGYESQLGTNHVGHALFTKLLLPTLLKTAEAPNSDVRIVNLSSDGHNFASFISGIVLDQDKLKTYNPFFRYGNSKLVNILYSRGLAKRYPQSTSVAVHPGVIYTDLYAPASQSFIMRMGIGASSLFWTGIDKGAWN